MLDATTASISYTSNGSSVPFSLKPSLSSLPLQVCLFYNSLLSAIFVTLLIAAVMEKHKKYNLKFVIGLLAVWAIVEPIRLYCGIYGNLRESVAQLSTFLLMTIFPQLALICYVAYFQKITYPIETIMGSLMFIINIFEVFFGLIIIRKIIKSQTAQFMRLIDRED